jgi:hypothetical protein
MRFPSKPRVVNIRTYLAAKYQYHRSNSARSIAALRLRARDGGQGSFFRVRTIECDRVAGVMPLSRARKRWRWNGSCGRCQIVSALSGRTTIVPGDLMAEINEGTNDEAEGRQSGRRGEIPYR